MLDLGKAISAIEGLLVDDSQASLTYAALECRLVIEQICYERLRVVHDYISHDDLKKWQPRDVVRDLIQQVDANTTRTFTLSISTTPLSTDSTDLTAKDFEAVEYAPLGTQIGFDPQKLGRLWNALAKLALHVRLPTDKTEKVDHYGDKEKIKHKVIETLAEIKRINTGTLLSTGLGEVVSFRCPCKSQNTRRLKLLNDGQIINCINPDCDESYHFIEAKQVFENRMLSVICRSCDHHHDMPRRKVEKLRTDQHISFNCEKCGETISVSWRPMQTQKAKPSS